MTLTLCWARAVKGVKVIYRFLLPCPAFFFSFNFISTSQSGVCVRSHRKFTRYENSYRTRARAQKKKRKQYARFVFYNRTKERRTKKKNARHPPMGYLFRGFRSIDKHRRRWLTRTIGPRDRVRNLCAQRETHRQKEIVIHAFVYTKVLLRYVM